MNSLLMKLMSVLVGITILAGGVIFNYLKQLNEEKILKQHFNTLIVNRTILDKNLNMLYKTIFEAYKDNPKEFQRIIKETKKQFLNNLRTNNIFKSNGFLIKDRKKIYVIFGKDLSYLFSENLSQKTINKLRFNNNIYYVSYLKFIPFNIDIIFYDTKKSIDKEVLDVTLDMFKVAIFFIILILLIMFLFVKFVILQPISDLLKTISQTSRNKYKYIEQFYTTKEFNLVKKYFNKMIDDIKLREEKIKTYLKDQEKRELFYYDLLNSQENIIIVNDSKIIEHVNEAFFRFFNEYSSLEEFLKEHKCICDFFVKEEGFIYDFEDKNWVEYLIQNQDKKHKVKIIKNNQEYIFNISAKKLKYSNKIVITLNDITSLEKEKEKVLELNRLLEDYKKAIDAGIIVSKTDPKGVITYVNDEFCRISGYTKDELIGKAHNIVRHPDMPKEVFKELWQTIKSGKIWKGEIKNRKKDGSEYYVKTIIAPLMNKDGKIIEYIALREDITDLIYAIKKAKEAEQIKTLFLSNMSHEIRTPLNGVLGFTELLLKSNNLGKKERRYVDIIHSSSKALLQIINDVLDLSKIESGNMSLEKKEFSPIISFKEAAELFKAKAKEKNIDLKIDLDFNLTDYIISDEFRIRQVISNLIGNAIKFTPKNGKVIFSVKQIDKNEKTSTICFSVKDTGIGIPKDKQKEIFKEFTQADNSVSRKYGGTGLGLSISSKIVKALGGELKVKSEEAKGSEFYFCIEVKNSSKKDKIKQKIASLNVDLYKINNLELVENLNKMVNSVKIVEKKEDLQGDLIISKEYLQEYKDKLILFKNSSSDMISILEEFDSVDILNALIDFVSKNSEYQKETKKIFNHKILIAEDNEVNQELLKALFDAKGLKYKIVSNGEEVIEAYKKDKFDLIFMDINMPKLDGLSATKEILKYEKENNLKHTPIVALSANAMKEQKEKFLEIMDDYLSKPIIEEKLNNILNKFLNKNAKISYSKNEMASKLGIPIDMFDKILDKFLETIDSYMKELQKAIQNDNLEQISYHSHKIKGSMVTFHLDYMVNLLKKMEKDSKEGIKRDYKSDFEKVLQELENFKKNIKG